MGRRLYWQDSYGKVHRDRRAERSGGSSGVPVGPALTMLVALALVVVIVSALSHQRIGCPARWRWRAKPGQSRPSVAVAGQSQA
jgi:hypothetical protein